MFTRYFTKSCWVYSYENMAKVGGCASSLAITPLVVRNDSKNFPGGMQVEKN